MEIEDDLISLRNIEGIYSNGLLTESYNLENNIKI
jgi:hypothetical protein